MQIVQNLQSISLNIDDLSLFHYFKEIITKNFSKVIGKKYKILSFFDEGEIQQRKYFLKLVAKHYKEDDVELDSSCYKKTFKLNFKEENALKPLILVDVSFESGGLIFKLGSNEKLFVSYIKQYFKEHQCEYNDTANILSISYKDKGTVALFESFASVNEHLKYCVSFKIDEDEYKKFKEETHKKENDRWKFKALAKIFGSYFQLLDCSPNDNIDQIRQKYLILVKLYHPDSHYDKDQIEQLRCREKFEQIQIAYDNLKALYKNNA